MQSLKLGCFSKVLICRPMFRLLVIIFIVIESMFCIISIIIIIIAAPFKC